jgi:mono/diheme cytochrome c family protein
MHVRSTLLAGAFVAAASVAGAQVPADSARPAADLYKSTCQPCHMPDGNAALEPMNFADGKWRHGSSVKEVAASITNGVPGTAMMPFKTRFSEKEILALAKFVRQFDKKLPAGAGPSTKTAKPKKPAATTP